jgi:hypothetical protein
MKTEDLIAALAGNAKPVMLATPRHRFASGLSWGLLCSSLMMALFIGVRGDIGEAVQTPIFWAKLLVTAATAYIVYAVTEKLGRPGARVAGWLTGLGIVLAVLALAVLGALSQAAPQARMPMVFGQSWQSCPLHIAMLSVPLLIAALWAMKGLAPTRPVAAGASAGLLAGSTATILYSLTCGASQLPYLVIWYSLGAAIPATIGATLGLKLFRW